MSPKKAEKEIEGEKNKGWRFWLRAVLSVIPQRNRVSLAKSSGVSRVYRNMVEKGPNEKDNRN